MDIGDILEQAKLIVELGILFVLIAWIPIMVTVINIMGFFGVKRVNKIILRVSWFVTFLFGLIYQFAYEGVVMDRDAVWDEQLYNNERHQAIWTGGEVSFYFLLFVGALALLILCVTKTGELPPIITVACFSGMYIACIEVILYCIQILKHADALLLLLFPGNCIIIMLTIILEKIKEWKANTSYLKGDNLNSGSLGTISRILSNAETWPILALVFMIPLLGILLCILTLFGQTPDKLVRTWTETAEWTLSTKIPPQNLPMDTHYLCTVAAGGHPDIVKPIRMGERHGHAIVVNRQLQIANAFENVLEEKTPRFHRALRNFYDKYGFPVADYIRPHKVLCDITYFVMKPLEWLFLLVLYTVDVNPENRIALQYMPKN